MYCRRGASRRRRDGIVSASFEMWTGAVEVGAAGITLTLLTGLPRVLLMMASFKMSLAFCRHQKMEREGDSSCEAPTRGVHKPLERTRK